MPEETIIIQPTPPTVVPPPRDTSDGSYQTRGGNTDNTHTR
jgi:hypothetical protein